MPKIKGKIKSNGKVEMEVDGVKGESCLDLTKVFDSLFSRKDVTRKDEFYEMEDSSVKVEI